MSEPIVYLVAERRDGHVLLGDEWTNRCESLAEAQVIAARWRTSDGRYEVVILAVTEVSS